MNEIKEIDAIINLYKDDVCDGLRNKLMIYINSHYIAKEKVKRFIEGLDFVIDDGDIVFKHEAEHRWEYWEALEVIKGKLNKATDLVEDNK